MKSIVMIATAVLFIVAGCGASSTPSPSADSIPPTGTAAPGTISSHSVPPVSTGTPGPSVPVSSPGSSPASLPTSAPMPAPTAVVVTAQMPVVRCKGTSAYETVTPPSTHRTTLPIEVAASLTYYAFDRMLLLGPKGWTCSDTWVAADQGFLLSITSPTDPKASIDLEGNAGLNHVVIGTACPYWPEVAKIAARDPGRYDCTAPPQDAWHRVTPDAVRLDATPAGPNATDYAAPGAIAYDSAHGVAGVHCSLPDAQATLCDAVIADFLTHRYPY